VEYLKEVSMASVHLVLMLLAFILFMLAGMGIKHPRLDLIAFGLAAWSLSIILG